MKATSPNQRVVQASELKPADILLSAGEGVISRVIMRCDGGSYSHAALWSGKGVIEATSNGVCETELYQAFDVYRATSLDAGVAAKVVEAARASIGRRYAYTEMLLLGLLFSVSLRPSRPLFSEAVARLGSKAESLKRWLDKLQGSKAEPRVCSELVAASYATANAPLLILERAERPQLAQSLGNSSSLEAATGSGKQLEDPAPSDELRELSRACRELFGVTPPSAIATGYEGVRTLLGGNIGRNSQGQPLSLVTPADLQFSKSLVLVGRVEATIAPALEGPSSDAMLTEPRSRDVPVSIAAFLDQLTAAIAAANYDIAGKLADGAVAAIAQGAPITVLEARRGLKLLRRKKMFAPMRRFAEAFLTTGQDDAQIRRQLAQALIEQGELEAAHEHLDCAKNPDTEERYEIVGVRGRALKQAYFDRQAKGPEANALLQRAVQTYLEGYHADRERNTWHGINAASLLRRAEQDGIPIEASESASQIAGELLDHIRSDGGPDAWLLATAAEADLVLGRPEEALAWARRYVQHEGSDTFELSSTIRQLKQVLGVTEDGYGKELLQLLNGENLKRSGGSAIPRAFREIHDQSATIPVVLGVNDANWAPPANANLEITARIGTIITARATKAGIQAMLADPAVVALEDSGPPIVAESVSIALDTIAAAPARTPMLDEASAGREDVGHASQHDAIVAIVDSGVDVCHLAFRKADGTTRILAYWDQADPTGPPPWKGAGGTVHWQADIADYLIGKRAVPARLKRNEECHGTHVASIAAGSPFGTFPGGIAPNAPLVVVVTNSQFADNGPQSVGYSTAHIQALKFIGDIAKQQDRPVVINVSQGQNAGAHDGTSPVEKAFEAFCDYGGAPGRVIVKSAGNECDKRGHARIALGGPSQTGELQWTPPFGSVGPHIIELWFGSTVELAVRLHFAGESSTAVSPMNEKCLGKFSTGTSYELTYDRYLTDNGATRVRVVIERGDNTEIVYGAWKLSIKGIVVNQESIHVWAERTGDQNLKFTNHLDHRCTLSIPGTAENVITVGAAELLADEGFQVVDFSSHGPTRRNSQKPDLVAPGLRVIGAKGGSASDVRADDGTSMAAPAVTGAIALALNTRPDLNAAQIRGMLCSAAGSNWNEGGGYGLLDVAKFLKIASKSQK